MRLTARSILSRQSLWLLEEYARRYSIAPLYRKIVFLNIIAFEGFEQALNRIWIVHETLKVRSRAWQRVCFVTKLRITGNH